MANPKEVLEFLKDRKTRNQNIALKSMLDERKNRMKNGKNRIII